MNNAPLLLKETNLDPDPIKEFHKYYVHASRANIEQYDAFVFSTASKTGIPSSRMVLLKQYDEDCFLFVTNYKSQKIKNIDENPVASLLFWWDPLKIQIRIEGKVEKTTPAISKILFNERPFLSRLASIASPQSSVIKSRLALEEEFDRLKTHYKDASPPCPEHWGGVRVIPYSYEFWQGRDNRLHDRFLYTKENKNWKISRLAP